MESLNYVGQLQEKCSKHKFRLPTYSESSENLQKTQFQCTCYLGEWTCEGMGYDKKSAKQNAAQKMLNKIENENLLQELDGIDTLKTSVTKLYEYCSKMKKQTPLFAEKSQEDDLFIFTCTFDDFTTEGKGDSKKIAKEKAADAMVKHFKLHDYFEGVEKAETRKNLIKNPMQHLHEMCQSKKLTTEYKEETVYATSKKVLYVVTCKVNQYETKSDKNVSKKQAKLEAASQMISLLNSSVSNSTPVMSPLKIDHEFSSEDEPLEKRVKIADSSDG